MGAQADKNAVAAEEDRLRAETYALLAALLARPPDANFLHRIADLEGDESAFGHLLDALAATAACSNPERLREEFHNLFIGLDVGEVVPYASYYIAGAVYSQPLARLRGDMAKLGIARTQAAHEPEDHIAALCEMMAGLIVGAFGDGATLLQGQKEFFHRHLLPWAPRFFADLERAPSAAFYVPVGRLGRDFMEIERMAFDMVG